MLRKGLGEATRGSLQSFCELHDIEKGHIALTSFDATDISPMEVGTFSELFLSESEFQSSLFDCEAEQRSWIGCHAMMLAC